LERGGGSTVFAQQARPSRASGWVCYWPLGGFSQRGKTPQAVGLAQPDRAITTVGAYGNTPAG
jgi:hypothetical protein